jgi:hypothetical protein
MKRVAGAAWRKEVSLSKQQFLRSRIGHIWRIESSPGRNPPIAISFDANITAING